MPDNPAVPPELVALSQKLDDQRQRDTEDLLSRLTEKERRLIREAAVMGWVQGMRHHNLPVPKDKEIVDMVVTATASFPDLYPIFQAVRDGRL